MRDLSAGDKNEIFLRPVTISPPKRLQSKGQALAEVSHSQCFDSRIAIMQPETSELIKHADTIWRTVFRILDDEEVARDCYQQTFLDAMQLDAGQVQNLASSDVQDRNASSDGRTAADLSSARDEGLWGERFAFSITSRFAVNAQRTPPARARSAR